MSDTDRAAAELADRIAKERKEELPLRVVGFIQTTDQNGDIVLLVQRSPLELKPQEVKASPAILKQIVGGYIMLEGRAQFAPVELARPAGSPQ